MDNYCLFTKNNFVYPLRPIKLSEMKLDRIDFATTLQTIYYKKTGNIIPTLGFNHDKDMEIAKELGLWD